MRFGLSTQTMIITPAEHNHFTGRVYAGEFTDYFDLSSYNICICRRIYISFKSSTELTFNL